MNRFVFTRLMYLMGVNDKASCTPAEASVYVDLLKGNDGGAAFLKIMRRFETTLEKEDLYIGAVKRLSVPVQFI
jgi:hypothetical protein